MPTTVTPAMIAVALGKPTPEAGSIQEAQWQMWIDDAVMLIDSRVEDLGLPYPSQNKVDYVVRQSVVSHAQHPEDSTQVTIATDDSSSSRSYQSGKGRVHINDDWWELLGLVAVNDGAYSVDMLGLIGSAHAPWCSLAFGATYCSCGVDIAGKPIFEDDSL